MICAPFSIWYQFKNCSLCGCSVVWQEIISEDRQERKRIYAKISPE